VSIGSEPGVNATGDELLRLNHRGKTRRRNSVLDRLCQTTRLDTLKTKLSKFATELGLSPVLPSATTTKRSSWRRNFMCYAVTL